MRKLHIITGMLLALAISAHGQVSNPSIIPTASNPSGNACTSGVPMLYYAGTYYGCDGTGHYAAVGVGGGGASISGTAITVSRVCSATDTGCFQVNDDVQVAQTATYTAGGAGGSNAIALTTSSDVFGGEYLELVSPSTPSAAGATIGLTATTPFAMISAGFKVASSPALVNCWGINSSGGSTATTVTVAVTPTGGSGHVLIAIARSGTLPTGFTFSDSSSSGQTWVKTIPAMLANGVYYADANYVQNVTAGSYNVTATLGASVAFRGMTVCEFSGLAASSSLDAAAGYVVPNGLTGSTATNHGIVTTADDLVVAFATSGSGTFTAGKIGTHGTITTQSSDPAFVSTDVGKKVLITTGCDSTNGYINCYDAFGAGTVSAFNSATSINISTIPTLSNASTGTNFTGWALWGHDDGAQIVAAWNAAQAAIGSTLLLPCGTMFVAQPPFLSTSLGSVYNPNIKGCGGRNGTILVPTSDYDYTKASVALFYSYPNTARTPWSSVYFQNPSSWSVLQDFMVWGAGVSGDKVSTALPMFNVVLTEMRNVQIAGWNWNPNVSANTMPVILGSSVHLDGVEGWSAGNGGLKITADSYGYPSEIANCLFGAQSNTFTVTNPGVGFQITDGTISTRNCLFYPAINTNSGSTRSSGNGVYQTGGYWHSFGDIFAQYYGTAGNAYIDSSHDGLFAQYGVFNAGANVSAVNTQLDLLNQTSGSFMDLGGNYACALIGYDPCAGGTAPWLTNTHSANSFTGGNVYGQSITPIFSAAGTALPSCSAVLKGYKATVSDANSPTFNGTYTSGGAVAMPVQCDGTNWKTY